MSIHSKFLGKKYFAECHLTRALFEAAGKHFKFFKFYEFHHTTLLLTRALKCCEPIIQRFTPRVLVFVLGKLRWGLSKYSQTCT